MEQFNIKQFKAKFLEEASDLLDKLDNAIVVLEKNPGDKSSVEQVFRIMHTLKGVSGMYGFDSISEITHHMESIYDMVREGSVSMSTQLGDLTLAICDHIRNLLLDETLQNPDNVFNHKKLLTRSVDFASSINTSEITTPHEHQKAITSDAPERTWLILFYPSDEIVTRCINLVATLHDLCSLGEFHIQEPVKGGDKFHWPIYLTTTKGYEEIEDVLLFVMDYFKIQLIADVNIFDRDNMAQRVHASEPVAGDPDQLIITQLEAGLIAGNQEVKKEQPKHKSLNTSRITVDASKLDTLMYLVSELVTTKSELSIAIETDNRLKTAEAAEKIDKLSKLFRENALDIRLVSLHDLLLKFNRLIRDLSHSLGKQVEFLSTGQDTELDKNILDTLSEPIMHLLRNCIDHGIEPPDERIRQGKKPEGNVLLEAYKSGNFVFIKISDDGRGIDTEKVRQKAIEKGIIGENQTLTDKQVWKLIFTPGFSTAETLTQVSGRGVGMDIVKKKIEEVRGDITIESTPGVGTSFTIKIQQTIAIIDTLLVTCGRQKFAIPLEDVENCELVDKHTLENYHSRQLMYNKELIPYISLHRELNIKNDTIMKKKMIVLNKNEKKYAIITDEIVGEYQAVIKPLGASFKGQNFLSGASILGDGSIALLLDTEKLKLTIQ